MTTTRPKACAICRPGRRAGWPASYVVGAPAPAPFRAKTTKDSTRHWTPVCRSRQLIQQRLRVLEQRRIETFREPTVDRAEQLVRLRALALVAPEPGET